MKQFFLLAGLFIVSRAFADGSVVADVTMNPMGDFKAKIPAVQGVVYAKGDAIRADKLTVDLRTLTTGIGGRDDHARNKYLEVEKYPEASLKNAKGAGGKGTGTLNLHGVDNEVSGTYTLKDGVMTAKFPIKLSQFKIEGINYKGVGVEDDVTVEVTVPTKPEPAAAPATKPAEKPAAKPTPAPKKK